MFNDFLDETKGFNCQITVKILFKKIQKHWNWIFFSLFYSITKTVTNHKFNLDKFYTELISGLMKVGVGLLNLSSLTTLIFHF